MKWLKKIFKREKTREVNLNELNKELKEKEETTKEEINSILKEIKETKKHTFSALETLQHTQLEEKNPQIISRVDSNRNSYIQQTKRMLENIKTPETITAEILEEFLEETTKKIKDFAERSVKSHQITKYLKGKELAAVSEKIKELTDRLKRLDEKTKELQKIKTIQKKIEEIDENAEKKKTVSKEVNIIEKEIKESRKKLDKKEEEKKELKESAEYKEYLELRAKTEQLTKEINKIKSDILNLFSPLQKALRKYSKISIEPGIIDRYIQDPYTAFQEDKEIKISEKLQKIDIKTLDIKEKEKKVKKAIEAANKEVLQEIKDKDRTIKEELKETKEKISKTDITSRIEQKEKEIKETLNKIKEKEEEFLKKKEIIKNIEEKDIKKEIKEKYQEITKEKINLS